MSALDVNHNYLNASRVGEASNPGPKPQAGLQAFVQQAVQKALQQALASLDLSALLAGTAGRVRTPHESPPPGTRAHRRKKAKLKKAAARLARAGGSQSLDADYRAPAGQGAKAKGKGKAAEEARASPPGKGAGPARAGKGKGGVRPEPPVRAKDREQPAVKAGDGWHTVQRKPRHAADESSWQLRKGDWDAPVIAFDDVAATLAEHTDGAFRAVVLCKDPQFELLSGMLLGSGKEHGVTAITLQKDGNRCPGEVEGQLCFRNVAFRFIHTHGQDHPKPRISCPTVGVIKAEPTTVLFARFHKQYMEPSAWAAVCKAPQKEMHLWAAKRNIKIHDSFSWAKERRAGDASEVIFGIIRVSESQATAITAHSGEGVFLDPSRKSNFPSFVTTWVDPLPKEAPLQYLSRVRATGCDYGIVVGLRSLGKRQRRDPNAATSRTWLLEHAPAHWTAQQAQDALATTFNDITMIRQRRNRSGSAYYFRASHTTDHDMVALPVKLDADQQIVLWARWAPVSHRVERQVIKAQGSWSLRKPEPAFTKTETVPVDAATTTSGQPSEEASANPTVVQADAAADGKTKRPQDGQQAAKKQCQAQRALPDSLTVQSIPTDGNCLFGAFSAGLALANGKSALHPTLIRAQVTQHLKKHQSAYEPLWQGELPDTTKSSDFAEYLAAIGREGSWGSSLEIRALARLYDTRIVIFPRQFHFNVAAVHTQQKRRVVVLLHNGSHFDLVKPVKDKEWPKEILEVSAELPPTMRGGGPSSEAASSLHTVWTAASARTVWTDGARSKKSSGKCSRQTVWTEARPSSRRQVRGPSSCVAASAEPAGKRKPSPSRVTAWTPSKKAASSVGSRAPGLSAGAGREASGDVEQDLEAMVQECAAGPRRRTGRPGVCQWIQGGFARCRLCPFRFKTSDPKVAQNVLTGHFRTHHKGHTPSGVWPFHQPMPSIICELSDDQDRVWQCKFCSQGISVEAARSAGVARIARDKQEHKRLAHPRLSWKQWRKADYGDRALATTTTKYRATAAKHPHLEGFKTFRWPRFGGKKSPQLARFIWAWACTTCHAPFILLREAQQHPQHCPSAYGRSRAAERLRNLRKLRRTYTQQAPKGPRRTIELTYFDEAERVFEQAASPLP